MVSITRNHAAPGIKSQQAASAQTINNKHGRTTKKLIEPKHRFEW